MYDFNNVVISGTHSHGTPGGFMMYLLYDLTTFGFVPESYRALALGIYKVCIGEDEYYDVAQTLHNIFFLLFCRALFERMKACKRAVYMYRRQKLSMPVSIVVRRRI